MALKLSWLWALVLNVDRPPFTSAVVSCIGESVHPVDWFIVYKLPRLHHSSHPYVTDGLGYVYMDSNSGGFIMPDKPIKSNTSAVGLTLQQIYRSYQHSNEFAYLMYNDEFPSGPKFFSKGHTKGDLGFDANSGFWLVHSVPKFPPYAEDQYDYPETGERYGQSFLCVTFHMPTFNDIGLQLLYNGPAIYDYHLPDSLKVHVPNIQKAIEGKYMTKPPYSNVIKLTSLENVVYISFAKSNYFEADLYDELVAPFYNACLLVETWQNGEDPLPSNCSRPTVENVKDLKLMDDPFRETEDHSKWGISKYDEYSLVCIGDINRMASQFKRGGGTLCQNNTTIWNSFKQAITEVENCPNSSGTKV